MAFFLIILISGIFFLFYMYKEAFADRVIYHQLFYPDFPASFNKVTIFFISDIHRRAVSDKVIAEAKGKADLVIIGGDLTEKGVPFERIKSNIKKLTSVAPVYFVWGNNDYEVDYHRLDATLADSGVKILDNTAVSFESYTAEKIMLMGVDDLAENRDRLDLALLDAGKEGFKILVSHNPNITEKILPDHNIRLVLSGHTHGGQIHILGFSPYEKGKFEKLNQTSILISNGYGTTALPLRLGAKAETHLITLKNG